MADDDQGRSELVEAMLDPTFYPSSPDSVALRETHISWVFLAGDLAYKVKKPLTLPFLDYGSVERRHEMCREEVRLNHPFAPRIYLGVVGIARDRGRWVLVSEDDPIAVEYAVEMQRVDESRSMAALAAEGALERRHVLAVAHRLARLHAEAPIAPAQRLGIEPLISTLEENLTTLREAGASVLSEHRLDAARHFTHAFLAAQRGQLEARARRGLIRDCHGDLRAEHVIVPERGDVYIFDCVEFDPALRQIDVGADLAFLVMDLAALGEAEFAIALADAYRDAGAIRVTTRRSRSLPPIAPGCARRFPACAPSSSPTTTLSGSPSRPRRASCSSSDTGSHGAHARPLIVAVCGVAAIGQDHARKRAGGNQRLGARLLRHHPQAAGRAGAGSASAARALLARVHLAHLPRAGTGCARRVARFRRSDRRCDVSPPRRARRIPRGSRRSSHRTHVHRVPDVCERASRARSQTSARAQPGLGRRRCGGSAATGRVRTTGGDHFTGAGGTNHRGSTGGTGDGCRADGGRACLARGCRKGGLAAPATCTPFMRLSLGCRHQAVPSAAAAGAAASIISLSFSSVTPGGSTRSTAAAPAPSQARTASGASR